MTDTRPRAVVGPAVEGVLLIDAGGRVTMCDRVGARLFGYRRADLIGRDLRMLIPAFGDGAISDLEDDDGASREVVGRRRDGEMFPLDLSIDRAEQDGKDVFVGVVRPAEHRRAVERRERLIQQLTAANEERGRFVQVAAHDLREPLRQMAAACGVLSRDYADRLDARGREHLQRALSSAGQMRALLDDLVAFDRLEPRPADGVWFEAGEALDQALQALGEVVRRSGAEIEQGPLPRIHGNRVRFSRLLQNLLDNALKYVAPGVTPRISVSATEEGEGWRFSVSDNGIGVAAPHRGRIFEPFQRLHARDRYEGSGLGLAICRGIVEDLGGRLEVRAAVGGGSTFSFTVARPQAGEAAGPDGAGRADRPLDLLLVDDSEGDVLLAREALRSAGVAARLSVAGDGEQALLMLQRAPLPDLVLLDLNLPRMSGREVLANIRGDPRLRSLRVVVLTGSRLEIEQLEGDGLRIDGALGKPIDPERLKATAAGLQPARTARAEAAGRAADRTEP